MCPIEESSAAAFSTNEGVTPSEAESFMDGQVCRVQQVVKALKEAASTTLTKKEKVIKQDYITRETAKLIHERQRLRDAGECHDERA